MKFTVSKTEIIKALSPTLGVVEKRHAMPMLTNILLVVEDNNISFTATDLESQVRTTCSSAKIETTGKTATSDQAQEIHGFIRSLITNNYNKDISDNTTILYGGSCKPSNAKAIFSEDDIDGGLIGGASLKSADFTSIISSI